MTGVDLIRAALYAADAGDDPVPDSPLHARLLADRYRAAAHALAVLGPGAGPLADPASWRRGPGPEPTPGAVPPLEAQAATPVGELRFRVTSDRTETGTFLQVAGLGGWARVESLRGLGADLARGFIWVFADPGSDEAWCRPVFLLPSRAPQYPLTDLAPEAVLEALPDNVREYMRIIGASGGTPDFRQVNSAQLFSQEEVDSLVRVGLATYDPGRRPAVDLIDDRVKPVALLAHAWAGAR